MDDLLAAIDAATRLCPCGAEKAQGSAYCSDDCRPTHIARDTDLSGHGRYATPARWRPDLPDDEEPASVSEYWYWQGAEPSGAVDGSSYSASTGRVLSAQVTVHMDDGTAATYDLHEGGDLEFDVERGPDAAAGWSRYRLEVRGRYRVGPTEHLTVTRRYPLDEPDPGGVAPER